jgi:hypothetical protein
MGRWRSHPRRHSTARRPGRIAPGPALHRPAPRDGTCGRVVAAGNNRPRLPTSHRFPPVGDGRSSPLRYEDCSAPGRAATRHPSRPSGRPRICHAGTYPAPKGPMPIPAAGRHRRSRPCGESPRRREADADGLYNRSPKHGQKTFPGSVFAGQGYVLQGGGCWIRTNAGYRRRFCRTATKPPPTWANVQLGRIPTTHLPQRARRGHRQVDPTGHFTSGLPGSSQPMPSINQSDVGPNSTCRVCLSGSVRYSTASGAS